MVSNYIFITIYIVRIFENVTMYPQYNKNIIKKEIYMYIYTHIFLTLIYSAGRNGVGIFSNQ
jgi:hypothetical protein